MIAKNISSGMLSKVSLFAAIALCFLSGCANHSLLKGQAGVLFGAGDVFEARGVGGQEIFSSSRVETICAAFENGGPEALELSFAATEEEKARGLAAESLQLRPSETTYLCRDTTGFRVDCEGPGCRYRWRLDRPQTGSQVIGTTLPPGALGASIDISCGDFKLTLSTGTEAGECAPKTNTSDPTCTDGTSSASGSCTGCPNPPCCGPTEGQGSCSITKFK